MVFWFYEFDFNVVLQARLKHQGAVALSQIVEYLITEMTIFLYKTASTGSRETMSYFFYISTRIAALQTNQIWATPVDIWSKRKSRTLVSDSRLKSEDDS